MMKKLLLCSALLTSFSVMNAQIWQQEAIQSESMPVLKCAPAQVTAPTVKYNLAADEINLGYARENMTPGGIGVGQPTNFDCAIRIPKTVSASYKGNKIHTIRVLLASTNFIEDGKVWIKKTLDGNNIVEKTYDLTTAGAGKWNDVKLDTPFELDGEEFYIGYSFTLTKLQTNNDKYPIGVDLENQHPDGIYLKFADQKWGNFYGQNLGTLAILGVCKGKFAQYDAMATNVSGTFMKAGDTGKMVAEISNAGKEEITSIDYELTFNGETKTHTNVSVNPIPTLQKGNLELNVTAPSTYGPATAVFKITKVNGQADENPANNTAEGSVTVLSNLGKRKVLVEEVTGTWCGWCPRGAVALELLNKNYSDKTVCIAVHNGDKFSTSTYNNIAGLVSGLPGAVVDRVISCDPFFGPHNDGTFGMGKLVDERAAILTPADIEITATPNGKKVDVTANVKFYFNSNTCDYKIAYVLIEDGLKDRQANYFAGTDPNQWPKELQHLCSEKSYINDFPLNDVARFIYKFQGVSGSLQGAIKDGEAKSHSYSLAASNVTDMSKAKVAVILFDKDNNVINVNQVKVGGGSGIMDTQADAFKPEITAEYGILNVAGEGEMEVEVYTVNGMKVAATHITDNGSIALNGLKGVYLVRVHNGNDVAVEKVVF